MVAFFKEFKDISVFFKDLRQKIETLNLRQDPGSTPVFNKAVLFSVLSSFPGGGRHSWRKSREIARARAHFRGTR